MDIYKLFVLLIMIQMHIVDEFYLQGVLSDMKQRSWWKKKYGIRKYRFDHLMALFMHSFSWTFNMMLAANIYVIAVTHTWNIRMFVVNIIMHMIVDHVMANQKEINFLQDQTFHILQIITTWMIMVYTR